jgi:phage shock protein A
MADDEKGGGGGFGWFILGALIGLAAGAYIASGPGRGQVDSLRSKTIELSTSEPVQKARHAAQRAREAVSDPDHPVGKAIQDGVAAAKRRRDELEAAAARKIKHATNGEDVEKGSGAE